MQARPVLAAEGEAQAHRGKGTTNKAADNPKSRRKGTQGGGEIGKGVDVVVVGARLIVTVAGGDRGMKKLGPPGKGCLCDAIASGPTGDGAWSAKR